jgi:hypothetical protein
VDVGQPDAEASEPDVSVADVVVDVSDAEDVESQGGVVLRGIGRVVGPPVGSGPGSEVVGTGTETAPPSQDPPFSADAIAHFALSKGTFRPRPSTPTTAPVITTSISAYSTLIAPRERPRSRIGISTSLTVASAGLSVWAKFRGPNGEDRCAGAARA